MSTFLCNLYKRIGLMTITCLVYCYSSISHLTKSTMSTNGKVLMYVRVSVSELLCDTWDVSAIVGTWHKCWKDPEIWIMFMMLDLLPINIACMVQETVILSFVEACFPQCNEKNLIHLTAYLGNSLTHTVSKHLTQMLNSQWTIWAILFRFEDMTP